MKKRIKELRKTLGLSGEKFGQALGLTRVSVSNLESGRHNLTEQSIILICKTYNVNEEWLRYGTGEMFTPEDYSDLKNKYNLSDVAIEVIKAYEKLSKDKQAIIDEIIDNLLCARQNNTEPDMLNDMISKLGQAERDKIEDEINKILNKNVDEYKYKTKPDNYIRETINVYIGAKCGAGYYLQEEQIEEKEVLIPQGLKYDFALLASGDSMQPTIQDGAVVFVKKTDYYSGRIYSIIVNGEGYIKRLKFLKDKIIAISDNKEYKPIEWAGSDLESAIICGEVIHIANNN